MTVDDGEADRRFRIVFSKQFHDLLPRRYRGGDIDHRLQFKASIKNVIESMGVPHTEIGQILANGQAKGFEYVPENESRVQVLPICPPLDVTCPSRLQPEPFDRLRFIVDVNVGKLALLLRILGLDTAYSPGWADGQIADKSSKEQRTVLSKDIELLKHGRIRFGRLVRAVLPDGQLKEVVDFFGIRGPLPLFSRCLRCNQVLAPVAKDLILDRLEPKTKKYYHRFKRCPDCGRIFWQGSHHEQMIERLKRVGIDVSSDNRFDMGGHPQDRQGGICHAGTG